ncbi:MAG TPA: hypothetical protein VHY22_16695, partial [Chthoniobacteraceae bacterium]|nr:hypothetical protein [Chthoniobacteraceae bacterium]
NTLVGIVTIAQGSVSGDATNTLAKSSDIIVINGGTFVLNANSALATPGAFTINSTPGISGTAAGQVPITVGLGTILRQGAGVSLGSGTSVGAGTLTLTDGATIDFGSDGSVGTLNFNGFVDSNNLFTLTILDYNRTTSGIGADGVDDRLIFNQQLTAAQLTDITINGLSSADTAEVALPDGEFELVAIPEPSGIAIIVMGAAMLIVAKRFRPRARKS